MKKEHACYHQPVLLNETVAALQPEPGKHFLDATLGGGGHSEALLQEGAVVLGADRDWEAIRYASQRLAPYQNRFEARHLSLSQIGSLSPESFDGVLMDLGVSSQQLDAPMRGFSFRFEAPLDMRMDQSSGVTAQQLIQTAQENEMIFWLRHFGEEPRAKAITKAICRTRKKRPIVTTTDLVRVIEEVYGSRRTRTHHPATRTFQALRIAVNHELDELRAGLDAAIDLLKVGGRLAVITFHSLEDRMVKRFLIQYSREFEDTPEWPQSVPNPLRKFSLITRKAIIANAVELENNPRSRSARLRVAEKIGEAKK